MKDRAQKAAEVKQREEMFVVKESRRTKTSERLKEKDQRPGEKVC